MAKRARQDEVQNAIEGPDFGAALAIINGRIAAAKNKQSVASGEASQAWASIEKMGIHKGGAQAAARIINMEDEDDRQDFLRSFSKLLEAAGVSIHTDMVDLAQGVDRPIVPAGGAAPRDKAADDAAFDAAAPKGDAQARQDDEPPVERPARKAGQNKLSVVAGRDALRGTAPPAPDAI